MPNTVRIEAEFEAQIRNQFGDVEKKKKVWRPFQEYGQPTEFPDRAAALAHLEARRAAEPDYYEDVVFRIVPVVRPDPKDMEREVNEAVQAVLAKYNTEDYPGCEFNGELRGLLQHKGHPETAVGWSFKIGTGLPDGWKRAEGTSNASSSNA